MLALLVSPFWFSASMFINHVAFSTKGFGPHVLAESEFEK
jgi:hypothetical protein